MTSEGVYLVHARDTAAHSAGQCRVVYPETTHVPLFRRIAAAAWQRCLVSLTLAFGLALRRASGTAGPVARVMREGA